MKNYVFKVAILATFLLFVNALNAQKLIKIGDEFDTDIRITSSYQKFKKSLSGEKNNQPELVFQKEFYSKNSSYIKLYFENFDLAPGDYIEIIGKKSYETLIYGGKGKIVDNEMTMISDFWSKVLFDDNIELKLYSFGNAEKYAGFEITKVAYGYTEDRITELMAQDFPEQKAICSSDNKERIACYKGTEIYEKSKAVCRLLVNGISACTGWLLGSEGHLMTNNHCISSSTGSRNTDFIFNYEYQNCTGGSSTSRDVVATSSTIIKTDKGLDYTLLQLPVNPTNTYGYLSLSSRVPVVGDRIYIPQHPRGQRKDVSVNTDTGFAEVSCVGNCATPNVPEKTINYFADTQGGSSGSPVIDYNTNLVIAIHNTGECPNGSFGRCDDLISAIGSDMPNNGVDGTGGGDPDPDPDPDPICNATVNSFPYSESFESNDGWTQVTGDDGNWVRDASGTPSSSTGPSSGADGSYYMFLESSTNGSTGQIGNNATAILESPCFDLSGLSNVAFSFSNHMYGSSIGSLSIEASVDGINWISLWSESGNQGNQWNNVSVDLSTYIDQTELRLRFVGTTGASYTSDIAIDKLVLSSGGSDPDPDPVCEAFNFNDYTITAFANQDSSGDYSIEENGASLVLTNNTWKYIPLDYTVTQNTVVEFEFTSTAQGEIHGIGFENDNSLTSSRYFKVHGTQNYGVTNYDNYTNGTIKYVIPIGSSYTGNMNRLVFINDNDAGSGNNSTFSNVKVYEGSCGNVNNNVFEAYDARVDILGDEDEDTFMSIQIASNPVKKGNFLQLIGTEVDLLNTSYTIISITGQVLKKGNINADRLINVDEFNVGLYILRIESDDAKISKRFVIE
ncbi:trypsin-like peptidase domain-containing protein [Aquimarina sp. 2201CG14-23]|uniref:trypsin-like peptidase domain-containing protein n=1 Tax=Aquimarina mycalae TaxID=3040073 RepID=UPI0024781DF3|nr:trypsin-like peptidase domain-containing protein [Aquimarina sp. 2201CG14-23]MDH7447061.1 trypsin-like peptidase domain-containing protein [Aquimarina sp. 2201CG14-23]